MIPNDRYNHFFDIETGFPRPEPETVQPEQTQQSKQAQQTQQTELSQPEDNMIIRRNNGSEIKITSIHGRVLVREGTRVTVWDKEKFLDCNC